MHYLALAIPALFMAGLFGLAKLEQWMDGPPRRRPVPEPVPQKAARAVERPRADHAGRRRPPIRISTRPGNAAFMSYRVPRRVHYFR